MNLHINLEVAACYYKKQEASSKITNHTNSLSLSPISLTRSNFPGSKPSSDRRYIQYLIILPPKSHLSLSPLLWLFSLPRKQIKSITT